MKPRSKFYPPACRLFLLGALILIHVGGVLAEPLVKELEPVTHDMGGGITEEIKRTAYMRGNRAVLILETSKVTMESDKKVLTSTTLLFPVSKSEYVRV